MPSREYTGGVSRSIHHGNMMNKRGTVKMNRANIHKQPTRRRRSAQSFNKAQLELDDVVVKGKPPKYVEAEENRFTIPNVEQNYNLIAQAYFRAHTGISVLVNELKTSVKIAKFSEDAHVEML
eukprot:CAMPEP_0173200818 /NCGR_PEP_ID=MMETSP1141-20130122/17999_1 /TAXON_ID=483371 /ORGANISM="non described non described, Strain CCMP2298" /LENGTH=122 /DNA_ID=CAMNT_0014125855 /DNA_START=41 /DNA_END=409 /DNA_ORIENTATION=+